MQDLRHDHSEGCGCGQYDQIQFQQEPANEIGDGSATDPTRTQDIRRSYGNDLMRLINNAEKAIVKEVPYSIHLSSRHAGIINLSLLQKDMLTMPPQLDQCIKSVKADLLKERPDLDPKEAESRAWAICRASLDLKDSETGLRNLDRIVEDDNWLKLSRYMDPIFFQSVQTVLDDFRDIIDIEITQSSEGVIVKYTVLSYRRGRYHQDTVLQREAVISDAEGFFGAGTLETVQVSPASRGVIQQLENLSFDLVKGVTNDMQKDLNRIIRNNALGTWDRDKVINEIVRAIQGTENISDPIKEKKRYFNRAKAIARTETVRAYNSAADERIQQVSEWYDIVYGGGPCPSNICPPIVASGPYRFDEAGRPIPPFHTNCGCTPKYSSGPR